MTYDKAQYCIKTPNNQAAEERRQDTRRFVRQIRSATRKKHTAEEKDQLQEKVKGSPGSRGKVRAKLGVSKSDCCCWRARARQGSL